MSELTLFPPSGTMNMATDEHAELSSKFYTKSVEIVWYITRIDYILKFILQKYAKLPIQVMFKMWLVLPRTGKIRNVLS
jgi:hypothetical protein